MNHLFSKPNQITIIRILLIPVFIYFLISEPPYKDYLAAFVFIVLSLSDALDGYIARKSKQVTELGKLIDPIADKLLISAALVFLIGRGIPIWIVVVILAREWIITGIRMIFVTKGTVVGASTLGKLKTISQTVGVVMVLVNFPFAIWVIYLAAVLTVISGIDYLIKFTGLVEGKVLNIPNLITLIRLVSIPVFAIFVIQNRMDIALVIFALIAISDKADGMSARMMKRATEFGSVFDSFTDWTFLSVSVISFLYSGLLSMKIVALLSIPAIAMAMIKMYNMKNHNAIISSAITKIGVGVGYLTIGSIIINFRYKDYFLAASLALAYSGLAAFILKSRSIRTSSSSGKRP